MQAGDAEAFSGFLTGFLNAGCEAVDHFVAPSGPLFGMVASELWDGVDLRTVTFQETVLAVAFAKGWDCARGSSRALRLL